MKRIVSGLLAVCVLAGLCACGNSQSAPDSEKAGVNLRVVTSYGPEDGNRRNYEAAVEAYEKSTGNRITDVSDTSNEEWKAKVLADFETGSEPDVLFFFANADAEPLIHARKVVSVEEIREVFPDYAGNMDDNKLPRAEDGLHYAVPITGYWEYLYVNRRVMEACGLELPDRNYNWGQFLYDCSIIREKGYTPIACSLAEVSHYWFEFAVLNNGMVADHQAIPELDETSSLRMDTVAEKWIAGLEDIRTLYDSNYFPENTLIASDSETVTMFAEGEAAFLLDGSWKVGFFTENYPDQLEDYAVCYVPNKWKRRSTDTIGGISTGFFITRKAWEDPAKREAAVEFVRQMTSDAVIGTFATTEITALKEDIIPEGLNPLQQSAAEAKQGTTAVIGAVQDTISGEARSSLFANIQNVVTGKISSRNAVEQAMQYN